MPNIWGMGFFSVCTAKIEAFSRRAMGCAQKSDLSPPFQTQLLSIVGNLKTTTSRFCSKTPLLFPV